MDAGQRRADQPGAAGKIKRGGDVATAAYLTAHGLPGWRVLETDDPIDHIYLIAVAEAIEKIREYERKVLAVEIVNMFAKALGR